MRYSRQFLAILATFCTTTWAQHIPDAGALMRQTEQTFRPDLLQRSKVKPASLPPEMVLNESTSVTVQRFVFQGNKLLTSDQLRDVTAPFVNRPLNQHDLQQLTYAVTETYRQIGWLVQAYIPRQDFKNAEMTLQVIESIPPNRPSN